MARTDGLMNFLEDVADAIKEKRKIDTPIPANKFDEEISKIELKEQYQEKQLNVMKNGTYTVKPDTGFGALSSAKIVVDTNSQLQSKSVTIVDDGDYNISPDENFDALKNVQLHVDVSSKQQSKTIDIIANGEYLITPDELYNALKDVHLRVSVKAATDEQHMPFYMLESDDDGNLWCINNYDEILYVPYSLDADGNLIVIQDDNDTAIYSINENMELEVVVNG